VGENEEAGSGEQMAVKEKGSRKKHTLVEQKGWVVRWTGTGQKLLRKTVA
jgi:hypothetical protein